MSNITPINSTTFGKSTKSIIKSVLGNNPTKNISGKEAEATLSILGYKKIPHTGSPSMLVNNAGDCFIVPNKSTLSRTTRNEFITTVRNIFEK